ncbi:hypothetical protein NXS98_07430 [Fontisphaera persica]|uniref:hypothetical protein n=1 Tax=Fontisphaera persica TaxID=2974023 RepID=UPI0024C03F2C|nr:hypothetical protein [Fontisphaera persica]WCJ60941.1 hypothetical protein NXS98_07430 [Fontisphaera persica]
MFDTIGNRRVEGTGGDNLGVNLREAVYTVTLLNQAIGRSGPAYAPILGEAVSPRW